jgi:lactoylglutathione lyase
MTESVPVAGLFEAHLTVSDLRRSVAFYRDVVGLSLALETPERGAAFFWVGRPGEALLGLWSLGSAPVGLVLHVAFKASLEDVLGACDRLRSLGVTPLSFFASEANEPSVIGWMPAAAVYFRDPDGHLLEYLAMLDEPPRPDRGILPWSRWASDVSRKSLGAQVPPVGCSIEPHLGPREAIRDLFELAEDSEEQLFAYMSGGDVLVAVSAGTIVGHIQLIAGEAESLEIKSLAVRPERQRQGIGQALVQAGLDQARQKSCSLVWVATAAADIENLRFYQRLGFRMARIERDAFTPATGYPSPITIDDVELRDRVWLNREP